MIGQRALIRRKKKESPVRDDTGHWRPPVRSIASLQFQLVQLYFAVSFPIAPPPTADTQPPSRFRRRFVFLFASANGPFANNGRPLPVGSMARVLFLPKPTDSIVASSKQTTPLTDGQTERNATGRRRNSKQHYIAQQLCRWIHFEKKNEISMPTMPCRNHRQSFV